MKTLLFLLLISISSASFGQNATQTNYLARYGQVWGFLKYFHPASGETNWDQRLLDDFEKVKVCSNDAAFNALISSLITSCGEYTPKSRNIPDSLIYAECYEWQKSTSFSNENARWLSDLLHGKPEFNCKYVHEPPVGRPEFTNEPEYAYTSYNPALNYLALTRYWNIINYYCPNRNLIPRNWTEVYSDYVPVFLEAKTYEDYYFAVRRLTAEIRDGHGFIRTKEDPLNNYKFVPFYFVHVAEGYFVTVIWQDSLRPFDVQKMDRIVALNGVPMEERVKQLGEYASTSNDYYLSKYTSLLRRFTGDSVSVTIERNGKLLELFVPTIDGETLMQRHQPKTQDVVRPPYIFLKDTISGKEYGYLDLAILKRSDINGKFKRQLRNTEHLIIDNRNYPNWTVLKLGKVLIEGKTKFAKFRKINFDYPGSFEWTESQTIGSKGKGYSGKIYVLVDYMTMSQAEYTVMAFQQHPNTVVIGAQTAGADGNISEIPLPYGVRSVFSGLAVYYPDGTCAQQTGVKRNYEVAQDLRHLTERRDIILEKALELMRGN